MFTLYVRAFGCDWEIEDSFDSEYDAIQTGKFMLSQGLICNYKIA